MDAFELDLEPEAPVGSAVNGSSVRGKTFRTTMSNTSNYVMDQVGIPHSPQPDPLAVSLGLGATAPFQGGSAVGAYSSAAALGCSAMGYHALARVSQSTAVGNQAQATKSKSIAIGSFANATGIESMAIGPRAYASEYRAIAIGPGAQAKSARSVAIGVGATSPDHGTALGDGATASGVNAAALGSGSIASGSDSIAIGSASQATADRSIAIGHDARSTHAASVSISDGSRSTAANQLSAGSEDFPLSDVYFGKGPNATTPAGWTLHGDEGDGETNKIGGALKIAGGRSTGTAKGGPVHIQVSGVTSSGTTLNTLYDREIVSPRKTLTNNTTTEVLRVAMPDPSACSVIMKLGLAISDGTNTQSQTQVSSIALIHDGSGYGSNIATTTAAQILGAGTLAVTVSVTQPASSVLAININSNSTTLVPTSIVAYMHFEILGESTSVVLQ